MPSLGSWLCWALPVARVGAAASAAGAAVAVSVAAAAGLGTVCFYLRERRKLAHLQTSVWRDHMQMCWTSMKALPHVMNLHHICRSWLAISM